MIIEQIRLKTGKEKIILSAIVGFKRRKKQQVYLSTDKKHQQFIANDASPFLAAVLIPCMKTGEDIIIHGSISQKLLKNTQKIMDLLTSWNKHLTRISITADQITEDTYSPKNTASFFSAGVDSFYTYLSKRDKINHFIFVNGFDIELENKSLFNQTVKNILAVAKKEKVTAIVVETNLKYIIEPVYVWDWIHGGALAAVALFLRANLQQLYVAGAVRTDQLFPYGTHPQLDYLWGSEKLKIVHHGNEYSRFEKIIHSISKSQLALSSLRVCTENTKGNYNCSQCTKCLRTMIQLSTINALHKAVTFKKKLDLDLVRSIYYDFSHNYQVEAEPVIAMLEKEQRDPELLAAVKESLQRSKKGPPMIKKIANNIALFDQNYNQRRFYTMIFRMNNNKDRNIFFKLLVKLGAIK